MSLAPTRHCPRRLVHTHTRACARLTRGLNAWLQVAVIGIGGLGHLALQFADKMGAEASAKGWMLRDAQHTLAASHHETPRTPPTHTPGLHQCSSPARSRALTPAAQVTAISSSADKEAEARKFGAGGRQAHPDWLVAGRAIACHACTSVWALVPPTAAWRLEALGHFLLYTPRLLLLLLTADHFVVSGSEAEKALVNTFEVVVNTGAHARAHTARIDAHTHTHAAHVHTRTRT